MLEWRPEGSDAFTTLSCIDESAPTALAAAALAVEAVGRRVLWKPVHPPGEPSPLDLPAGVPERYVFLYSFGSDHEERHAAGLPYESIEMERSTCYGSCPAFLVRFSRDGRATWEGRAYSAPAGNDTAEVPLTTFGRMCWLVEKLELERLAGRYCAPWTCDQTTTIRLFKPGGEIVVFHDYGRRSPIEVFALTDMIELSARQLGWAQPGAPVPVIRAKVTEVNRDSRTIVLDKGSKDGVQIGITLDVYRGSTYKGLVRVTGVEGETCSALIVKEKGEMFAGDLATNRL